jgi:hypothetical protein
MGQQHSRLTVWALAVMTAVAVFGTHSAFALNPNYPRVEASGWFNSGTAVNGTCPFGAEIKFGVTGNSSNGGKQQGRFDYFNTCTGVTAHGSINSVLPGTSCPGSPSTAKAVDVSGSCDNNSNCGFHMILSDGGPGNNTSSSKNGPPIDYVCFFQVAGQDKSGQAAATESDGDQPLFKGNITVQSP